MKRIVVDFEHGLVEAHGEDGVREFGLGSAEGLRPYRKRGFGPAGMRSMYTGSRGSDDRSIQLPDDMVRLQEVI